MLKLPGKWNIFDTQQKISSLRSELIKLYRLTKLKSMIAEGGQDQRKNRLSAIFLRHKQKLNFYLKKLLSNAFLYMFEHVWYTKHAFTFWLLKSFTFEPEG